MQRKEGTDDVEESGNDDAETGGHHGQFAAVAVTPFPPQNALQNGRPVHQELVDHQEQGGSLLDLANRKSRVSQLLLRYLMVQS